MPRVRKRTHLWLGVAPPPPAVPHAAPPWLPQEGLCPAKLRVLPPLPPPPLPPAAGGKQGSVSGHVCKASRHGEQPRGPMEPQTAAGCGYGAAGAAAEAAAAQQRMPIRGCGVLLSVAGPARDWPSRNAQPARHLGRGTGSCRQQEGDRRLDAAISWGEQPCCRQHPGHSRWWLEEHSWCARGTGQLGGGRQYHRGQTSPSRPPHSPLQWAATTARAAARAVMAAAATRPHYVGSSCDGSRRCGSSSCCRPTASRIHHLAALAPQTLRERTPASRALETLQ